MRIVLVGDDELALTLTRELERRGHEPWLVTASVDRAIELEEAGLHMVCATFERGVPPVDIVGGVDAAVLWHPLDGGRSAAAASDAARRWCLAQGAERVVYFSSLEQALSEFSAVARPSVKELGGAAAAVSEARSLNEKLRNREESAMTVWGTSGAGGQTWMLLGSGELGREVAIEAMRLGVRIVACDNYDDAPGMRIAEERRVFDMRDGAAVRAAVEEVRPDAIVPEVEGIHTETLLELEAEGWRVIPTARAANLTMNREGIRRLAAEELGLKTSPYRFASSLEEVEAAAEQIGLPVVIKPLMSSSGKGQRLVREAHELSTALEAAYAEGRGSSKVVIVEGFVDFDFEITLLTIRDRAGDVHFCEPIGHLQEDGDYRESWQPQPMSALALKRSQEMAGKVANALGGCGIFGIEFFIKGDDVIFSEVSPRPHDTGMVTMASQNMSEFELHVRAIAGLPIPEVRIVSPGASAVVLGTHHSEAPRFSGVQDALHAPDTWVRMFNKPVAYKGRRMGVVVARAADVNMAREAARRGAAAITHLADD